MIKVLVVEDTQAMPPGRPLSSAASSASGSYVRSPTRVEALDPAEHVCPNAALIGIDLPGMDGIALASALSSQVPSRRAAVLTAMNRHDHVRRALDTGGSGYPTKSVSPPALAEAVRTAVTGGRVIEPPDLADTLDELLEE
ncbi:response regulator [Streptomyces sp. NPDC090106]|uniref:response regulator n=1 Tax=Streptomyces sp. NPDC090106 TaxID=3365946 RepID=UPI0038278544